MNQFSRNLLVWAVIILGTVMLFNVFQQPTQGRQSISYSDLMTRVDSGQITSVTIQGQEKTALLFLAFCCTAIVDMGRMRLAGVDLEDFRIF